jgi:hypothetical protein
LAANGARTKMETGGAQLNALYILKSTVLLLARNGADLNVEGLGGVRNQTVQHIHAQQAKLEIAKQKKNA